MRDIIVALFIVAAIPISGMNPVAGVKLYALVSYLNPHRLTWSFARELPIAFAIAGATLLGYVFYSGDRRLPVTREISLLILLWLLATSGCLIALNPEGYVLEWKRFSKILLMVLVSISLIKSRQHLRGLCLIIALSIGFYSLKGAIWGLLGGGEAGLIWGPPGTFFEGNNEMGLVINMVWPLFLALARSEENPWTRRLFWCLFGVSPLTVILTQSRGAALALFITSTFLFMKVKRKLPFLVIGVTIMLFTIPFVPESWYMRMNTIKSYEQDGSAMGRINAWHAAWNMAVDRPLTGGGMSAFTPATVARYAPNPEDFHDVHSIYFEVLGEIGFPGLFVFLALILATACRLLAVIRESKSLSGGECFSEYSNALLIGLVAYAVNGTFLGLAYFDLFYQYVGLAVSLHVVMAKELQYQELWEPEDRDYDVQDQVEAHGALPYGS